MASAALLPVAPVVVGGGAPAGATTIFAGLDCGALGDVHSIDDQPGPYTYAGLVEFSAGPYAVSGTNAFVSCTLRLHDPGGPVLHSWAVGGGGTGVVPAMVPEVREIAVVTPEHLSDLYVCSRVSWTDPNLGPQTEVGCGIAGGHLSMDGRDNTFDFYVLNKVQDNDLDNDAPLT